MAQLFFFIMQRKKKLQNVYGTAIYQTGKIHKNYTNLKYIYIGTNT
jgi:hypothetical protein